VEVGEQGQDAFEAEHRIGPAVEEHDDGSIRVRRTLVNETKLTLSESRASQGSSGFGLVLSPVVHVPPGADQLGEVVESDAGAPAQPLRNASRRVAASVD